MGKENELGSHYKWLAEHLEEYPNNQKIMDAIMDASNLKNAGKLEAVESGTSYKDMVILDSAMKPLLRNQRESGKYPVYQTKVVVHPEDKYPVEVTITTFDAPVNKLDSGMLNVIAQQKENELVNSMRMSFADFGFVLKEMDDYIANFKMINCMACYKDSEACEEENKKAS